MSKSTYDRQMSAIVGKLLSDLEEMEFLRPLHPFQFERLRRRCIDGLWDAHVVGRNKGLAEAEDEQQVHTS